MNGKVYETPAFVMFATEEEVLLASGNYGEFDAQNGEIGIDGNIWWG
ncbi:MAG: hypothetical protein J6Y43_00150 [Clostridia bacterium]|nr:hypothetical protein [Clostridia bacterium]